MPLDRFPRQRRRPTHLRSTVGKDMGLVRQVETLQHSTVHHVFFPPCHRHLHLRRFRKVRRSAWAAYRSTSAPLPLAVLHSKEAAQCAESSRTAMVCVRVTF